MDRPLHLLTLSADSQDELKHRAGRLAHYLAEYPQQAIADVCFTLNSTWPPLPYRLALLAESSAQTQERLAAFAAGRRAPGLVNGQVRERPQVKVAFLLTGQGSQYVGMGRQLYETQLTFRQALNRCAQLLSPYLEHALLTVLYPKEEATSPLDETAYTQPSLFALEYALADLWRSWGVEPDVVMGHSVGEYVAAHLAGVFGLEDGLKLIALRGRLMQALPRDGAMAVVSADETCVAAAIAPFQAQLAIAAVNGPRNVVISGAETALQAVRQHFEAEGIQIRRLTVSHAFHSPLMESICDPFEEVARAIQFQSSRIPLVSNLTGEVMETLDASYWRRHIRGAVHFAAGMKSLAEKGYQLFLELGPSPALLGMGRLCLPRDYGKWLPSLRENQEDWRTLLTSLGALYVEGVPIDWVGFDQDYRRTPVTLPWSNE
ncbi:MAG: acyltransferase domain-containing protein [Chloroflexi bacterium]|nr:acyltransferase domain-containing protein [Chloroflexota bacterium]